MKFLSALSASLLLAGESWLVAAAGDCANVAVTAIPSCAQSCFLNGAPSVGCAASDFACQCEQEARLYAAIEGCVSDGCPSASYQAVIDGASSVCGCATAGQARAAGGSMTVAPGSSFASATPTASSTGSFLPTSRTKSSQPSPTATGTPAATTTATSGADRRQIGLTHFAAGMLVSGVVGSLLF